MSIIKATANGQTIVGHNADYIYLIPLANVAGSMYNGANSPTVSADGTTVVFSASQAGSSFSPYLISANLVTGALSVVSTRSNGQLVAGSAYGAHFTDDGTSILFTSSQDLGEGTDYAARYDIYLKNLTTGAVTLVSANASGARGNGNASGAAISHDGTTVVFSSDASNLVTGDTNGVTDLFVKNLSTGSISRISTGSGGQQANQNIDSFAMSADGSKVAFSTSATSLGVGGANTSELYVKNLNTGALTAYNSTFNLSGGISMSADGSHVTYSTGRVIYQVDLATGVNTIVSQFADGTILSTVDANQPRYTSDGSSILFQTETNQGGFNVGSTWLKNLSTGDLTRVAGGNVVNDSTSAQLFGNGTEIAYATSNGSTIAVKELTGADTIVAGSFSGTFTGAGGADTFVFSPGATSTATVTDFSHADGDRIDLTAFSAVRSLASVMSHAAQVGANTQIVIGSNTITLANVTLATLTAGDFIFGVNHAPTVAASAHTVAANSSTAIASWLTYLDADSDAAVIYRFWDGGTDATSAYFSDSNSAHEPSGANIDVAAANIGSVQIHGGSAGGSETMWVQAFDGTSWGAWSSFTLTTTPPPANRAPTVAVANHTVGLNSTTTIASWLTYTDADGDAAVTYRFYDDGGPGYLSTFYPSHAGAGVAIDVPAANLSSVLSVVGGATAGSQTMWVQAYDGHAWGPWTSFVLTSTPNSAPTVAASNHVVGFNTTTSVFNWLTYADGDGDAAVAYRFSDGGENGGYLSRIGDSHVAANTVIEVSAAELSTVQFHGGPSGGSQFIYVSAYDGKNWGAATAISVTSATPGNTPPSLTSQPIDLRVGRSYALGPTLHYSDTENDPVVAYRFRDAGGNDGYLSTSTSSHVAVGANIDVAAADLSSVVLHAGSTIGSQKIWVQAFDGKDWGAWTTFDFGTTPHLAPVLSASTDVMTLNSGVTYAVSNLFSYSSDSDPVVTYRLWDGGTDPGSAYFSVPGNAHAGSGVNIDVAAADFSSAMLHMGAVNGSDTLWAQAFDGHDWSSWVSLRAVTINAPVNHAPTITASNHTVAANSSTAISSWLTYADADSDPAVTYRFWGSSGGAAFTVNGAAQANGQNIDVAAANLSTVSVHGDAAGGSQVLWLQVYDGQAWSAWSSFTLTTTPPPVNHAPTLAVADHTVSPNASAAISSWLTYADADSDAAVTYRFWGGAGGATFTINGATQANGQNIDVAAANISTVGVHGSSTNGSQQMWVQVYDGQAWSSWQSFNLTTQGPVNHAPTITASNHTVAANSSTAISSWLTYADADSDPAVTYRFWGSSGGAAFTVNGAAQANGQNIDVAAANLSTVSVHGDAAGGSQVLWLQVYDGQAWSAWSSFTLTTTPPPVNHAPTLAVADHTVSPNASAAISSWLTYADADSDAAVTYRFWGGAGGATFTINGATQANGQNIDVAAANISTVGVHGSSTNGSQQMWVQVYDGQAWSSWQSFNLTTQGPVNHAPTITASNHTVAANSSTAISSWLTYADADSDPAVTYRFWDGGSDASSAYFSDNANAHENSGVNVDVTAANLGSVQIHGGSAGGTETMWVQAYDGTSWSPWTSFTLTTTPNHAPAATIANQTLAANATVNVAGLISYSDTDGDAAAQYRFWDGGVGSASGYFSDNASAHETAGVNITVAAADLGSVVLHGGSAAGSETMWVQAYDGHEWGAWSAFTLLTA